jgi:hypothetical protein
MDVHRFPLLRDRPRLLATGVVFLAVLMVLTTGGYSVAATTAPLWIGTSSESSTNTLGGTVDEVAVYSYALSAAQITAQYNAGHQ